MYLSWDQRIIDDFSARNIEAVYNSGFVFTRLGKGVIQQTRSARINLLNFRLSSENRRILKKGEDFKMEKYSLPYPDYFWEIGKIGKDFYNARGAEFSANKIKELITDFGKSSFNSFLIYTKAGEEFGYCIGYESDNIFHYSYPFYKLNASKDMGLIMMLMAIMKSVEEGKEYFYLGSLQRSGDIYKLQFSGLEWFNGREWRSDIDEVKEILL